MQSISLPNAVDVVVIGGGLAGLTCAVALSERGMRVAVLERDPHFGGRAQSWIDATTGDPVHIGPHIMLSAYPNMRALLRRLGTEERIHWLTDVFIHLVEGTNLYPIEFYRRLPPPLHLLPNRKAVPGLSRRDTLSNIRAIWKALRASDEELKALDEETALVWLRRMGVTDLAIQRAWAFVVFSILNVPVELCSAGALVRFFREMIGHRNVCIGIPTCGLGDLFVPRACEYLNARQSMALTNMPVQSILGDGRRAVGVRLADGRTMAAQWVISTVPPANLRPLLPEAWQSEKICTDLEHFVPCPYISTYLWFDGKLTNLPFWARVPADGDFNCDFYDLSNLPPGWPTDRSIITSNIIWSHRATEMTDEQIIAQTRRELAEFLPAAATTPIRHAIVNRIPMAIHCPFPEIESRKPAQTTPFEGFFLAGDWVKTGVPSSMEGACRSGNRAAELVLASQGIEAQLVQEIPEIEGIARFIHRLPTFPRHFFTRRND